MPILVIEDDEHKRSRVVQHLRVSFPREEVGEAKSVQGGLAALLSGSWDLVVLDMTMPTFDIGGDEPGGRPQVYGGGEVLRQLQRKGLRTPVLLLTQFDQFGEGADALRLEQLDEKMHKLFPENYHGAIFYSVVSEDWREALTMKVEEIRTRVNRT